MRTGYSKFVMFAIALMIGPMAILALPPDPPGGGAPPCGGPFGAVCPIDGGISFLIAAGLAVGGKKAFDLSRKKQE